MTPWNEFRIARAISRELLARRCVCLVDRCNWTGHECDVLGLTLKGQIIDVEIKISRSDLRADAKKDKWWHRRHLGWGPEVEHFDNDGRLVSLTRKHLQQVTPRPWPPKVWKHYYCLPAEIWAPELLTALPSPASGILLVDRPGAPRFKVIRRAAPARDAYVLKPAEILDVARLANLRMWDAYMRADQAGRLPRRPVSKSGDHHVVSR